MKTVYVKGNNLIRPIALAAPSRVSLVGNPSDLAEPVGIGAVLSMPARALNASVAIMPSDRCRIQAPRSTCPTLQDFIMAIKMRGAGDWEMLVDKALEVFDDMLKSVNREVLDIPMAIHLETNIPRQRGMSGSSGMIIALLKALLEIHHLANRREFRPQYLAKWGLEVEERLGVDAGLQDRILQAVALSQPDVTAVFMDFARETKETNFRYTPITANGKLFSTALILSSEPSHSGEVHRPIKRKLKGKNNSKIKRQFRELEQIARAGLKAFLRNDWPALGELMVANAMLRIEIYGQQTLGPLNMALVEICQRAGCPFNFTGSGGAVVAMLPDRHKSFQRLQQETEDRPEGKFEIYRIN